MIAINGTGSRTGAGNIIITSTVGKLWTIKLYLSTKKTDATEHSVLIGNCKIAEHTSAAFNYIGAFSFSIHNGAALTLTLSGGAAGDILYYAYTGIETDAV